MISNVFSLHISLTLSAKTPAALQMYFASITPLFVSILYVSFSFSIPETFVFSFTSTPFNTAVSASARANSHGLTIPTFGELKAATALSERFGSSFRSFSLSQISISGTPFVIPLCFNSSSVFFSSSLNATTNAPICL